MLFHLPIEPYQTRYTADWIKQYESEFYQHGVPYMTIEGETNSDTVSEGGVLDACGTHMYKFSQLSQMMKLIQSGQVSDGDVIFFSDLWFPGLESLFYVRNMLGIKFKICGILHAGTYDEFDFTYRNNMRPWGKYLEQCWLTEIDTIFVATQFHKKLILAGIDDNRIVEEVSNKIYVTGLPFYAKELQKKYLSATKENIIVFPHRLDPEKHPELLKELEKYLVAQNIDNFKIVTTINHTKNRDEYFKLLAKAKVMISFADQETFGYSTLESMALGCIAIVPNKLSYVETVLRELDRYDTYEQAFHKVAYSLLSYPHLICGSQRYPDITRWEESIGNMINIMKENGYGI